MPNFLFLMTDEHRADFIGAHPQSRMSLPHLDRLSEGTTFLNCTTINPICTPARCGLLTGKYAHQIGMLEMSGDLSHQHPTYLQALQRAGYWTAGIGKFHFLQTWPWGTPKRQGIDLVALEADMKRYGFDHIWESAGKQLAVPNRCHHHAYLKTLGLIDEYCAYVTHCKDQEKDGWLQMESYADGNAYPLPEETYIDIQTGDEIVKAIKQRPKDKPFMIFGSFCGPHPPYDPPSRFLEQVAYEEEDNFVESDGLSEAWKRRWYKLRRAYKAMLLCIDEQVGRILATLESEGLMEETVILFTSDHGEMLGDRNLSGKHVPWWQSSRVPCMIRHPQFLMNRRVESPVELTDLTATILNLAGLDPNKALSKPWPAYHDCVPGKSLSPLITGKADSIRSESFSECGDTWQMLESNRWKYIRTRAKVGRSASEALYDKATDPDELVDVAAAHPEVVADFRSRLMALLDRTPVAQLRWAPLMGPDPDPVR